jgi:tetratricopeptide (TPR) repeat protein
MAIEDIERLKEKIEKDPNSKLFVPLAEEYKKVGMVDEAIDALTNGLERQPNYLSARVSLGKIYIEKGMLTEAKVEFEKVVASIPDNLYAHKKLAEIYTDLGEREKAMNEFRMVLKLNPMDDWAASNLSAGEAAQEVRPQDSGAEKSGGALHGEELFHIEEEKPAEIPFTERDKELSEALPEIGEELKEETEEGLPENPLTEEDMELWKTHLKAVEETREEEKEPSEASPETGETAAAMPEPVFAEELSRDESLSFEDLLKEAEPVVQVSDTGVQEKEFIRQPMTDRSAADADLYIQQGEYGEAMSVYRTILSSDPENRQVLQRVEELRALLKLLGKDKEELVAKLEIFLEGIKRRRDEFFRNP